MSNQNSELCSILKGIKENLEPRVVQIDGAAPYLLHPETMRATHLKSILDQVAVKPERRKGTALADNVSSFIELTNRFKDDNSVIFARAQIDGNEIRAALTSILDYNLNSSSNLDARFGEHRIKYEFPLDKDFKFWLENNTSAMEQNDFAYFIEDRINDLIVPDQSDVDAIGSLQPKFANPMEMLELSRDLEIYAQETVRNKIKLSSGEKELQFTTQHTDASGKPIQIPDFFVIGCPIFHGGNIQRLPARLRYRIKEGKILWSFDLYRIDKVLDKAFNDACDQVKQEAQLPLYVGHDEK